MMDEYSVIRRYTDFGMITGKPIVLGGSKGRSEATARGVVVTTLEAIKKMNMHISDATVAIQGFGNAGSVAANILYNLGAKIVAISDSKGAVYSENGLDPKALEKHKDETGSVVGFSGGRDIAGGELLELPVDILIPAALEKVITEDNAPYIKAKIVAEAANGPTMPKADEILNKNGVLVIPDILCNAGGVTVSYFEWVQNNYGYYWSEDEVNSRLTEKMQDAFFSVWQMSTEYNTDMRTAAYMVAVKRISEAIKLRGWV